MKAKKSIKETIPAKKNIPPIVVKAKVKVKVGGTTKK
jgi:hypothetical protein